jgi:hypothetical protein
MASRIAACPARLNIGRTQAVSGRGGKLANDCPARPQDAARIPDRVDRAKDHQHGRCDQQSDDFGKIGIHEARKVGRERFLEGQCSGKGDRQHHGGTFQPLECLKIAEKKHRRRQHERKRWKAVDAWKDCKLVQSGDRQCGHNADDGRENRL